MPTDKKRHRFFLFRAKFLVPLAALILAGTGVYFYLCYHFPTGEGPAGPPVPRELFAQPWTQRKVLLLGLGDSVTAGFGVPKDRSYFHRLAMGGGDDPEAMRGVCLSAVIPNLTVRNAAVSGSNSIAHLEKQIASMNVQDADVMGLVVMTTGGNDILHEYGRMPPKEGAMYGATMEQAGPWIDNFRQRLDKMLDELNDKFPGGCEVFLADIYDPTDGKGVPWGAPYPDWKELEGVMGRYNEIIHAACRRPNVHLVLMHDAFLGHGLCCSRFWERCHRSDDPTVWYAINIEDPNERGYDAIRRLFLLEMAKVLRRQGVRKRPFGTNLSASPEILTADELPLDLYRVIAVA